MSEQVKYGVLLDETQTVRGLSPPSGRDRVPFPLMSAKSGAPPMGEQWNNRSLFRLIWPLLIEQLLAVTMGAADTAMVGVVGEFAVSGINIVDNINNLLAIAFIALSTGGAVVVSQYIGRQDAKNSSLASRQLVYSVFFVSLIITVVALILRRPVIRVIYGKQLEADVMNAAMTYFFITALSYPMLAIYNACAALFRATGNSKVPMKIAVLVNILNVGGNAFFIFGLHIGVTGAAFATLISRTAAAVVLLVMLTMNRRSPISLSGILKIKLVPSMIRTILNVGVPTGLESSLFQVGRLLTQRIFPSFGTAVMAANAVSAVINSFSFMSGNAYGLALLTVVGQCIGAGDYEAAKKYTKKIITMTWLTVIVISAFIFIFKGDLVDLFGLSEYAGSVAKGFLNIHCIFMALGWTLSFALPNALRAAGDARFIMIIGTISMWTVRVSGAYFFSFTLKIGPAGVWLAMGGDFIFRAICFSIRWYRGRWQKMNVIDSSG